MECGLLVVSLLSTHALSEDITESVVIIEHKVRITGCDTSYVLYSKQHPHGCGVYVLHAIVCTGSGAVSVCKYIANSFIN